MIMMPDGDWAYLNPHHTFGRLAEKVDVCISDPLVSRIHAVIFWHNPNWFLRDLSRNGSWLNGKRVNRNEPMQLNCNDKIQFGRQNAKQLIIHDTGNPRDALIKISDVENYPDIFYLEPYTLIPNNEQPEIAIYQRARQWYLESLQSASKEPEALQDNAEVSVNNETWQLRQVLNSNETEYLPETGDLVKDLRLVFNVSQDEEHCKLEGFYLDKETALQRRSHHLVTLLLARYRAEDVAKNYDIDEQGWVYVEQLTKDLGMPEQHINIHIHRTRKQVSKAFQNQLDCSNFIERRFGQLRLGVSRFTIIKAGKTEFSSDNEN